jgi:hypothetical protein
MPEGLKTQEDKNMANLKKVIEANTKNYFETVEVEMGEITQ